MMNLVSLPTDHGHGAFGGRDTVKMAVGIALALVFLRLEPDYWHDDVLLVRLLTAANMNMTPDKPLKPPASH
jgi:hypothetical protein